MQGGEALPCSYETPLLVLCRTCCACVLWGKRQYNDTPCRSALPLSISRVEVSTLVSISVDNASVIECVVLADSKVQPLVV
jgi:hypothetical protein